MGITNFFITGVKGVGKSTLLNEVIKQCKVEDKLSGFRTLPYYEFPIRKGFYLHSLEDIQNNNRPISWQKDQETCERITLTFETLGVMLLNQCVKSEKPYVLMDELGVLEREAYSFQNAVREVLDSNKIVIGVLKDKSHPFLNGIRTREDTVVYTLTRENFNDILSKMVEVVEGFNQK